MIIETFEAMKEIKVFQKEKLFQIYLTQMLKFLKKTFFFNVFDKMPRIFLELVSIVSILLISIIYLSYSDDILEALPILVLIIVSAIRLIPAFSGISTSLFYLRVYTPNLENVYHQIKQIRSLKDFNLSKKKIKKTYQDNLDINKNFIVIDNISFSYEETKPLLENINFSIPKILSYQLWGHLGVEKVHYKVLLWDSLNLKMEIYFLKITIYMLIMLIGSKKLATYHKKFFFLMIRLKEIFA